MCKFCSMEPGDVEYIEKLDMKVTVGDKVIRREMFTVGYYINDNDVPEHYLAANNYMHDGTTIASIEIPINYCPFCGRKVRND